MLEASIYGDNCFVTLTYEEDPGQLQPRDLQLFMKSFRKAVAPMRVRFYAVGEYGDLNERPHYHLALFGFPHCKKLSRRKFGCNCKSCTTIYNSWRRGFISNLPLEPGSARYIARYVIKKMTRRDDPRLYNREPEFSRKSLKPGIGFGVLDALSFAICKYRLLTPQGDVPVTLRHGTLEWPLGRYLRRKLRLKLGLDERSPSVLSAENAYAAFQENHALQAMWAASISDRENPSPKFQLLKMAQGELSKIEARHKLFYKKGEL